MPGAGLVKGYVFPGVVQNPGQLLFDLESGRETQAERHAENPKAVEGYHSGDAKLLNFLMGRVMKKTEGKADPAQVRELLARKLGG